MRTNMSKYPASCNLEYFGSRVYERWRMILVTLALYCVIMVKGQFSITWNGTTLTGPVAELIYHDELLVDTGTPFTVGDPDRNGALVCRSGYTSDRVSWHFPTGFLLNDVVAINGSSRELQQIRETGALYVSRLSRNGPINRADLNGLWRCRRNDSDTSGGAPVAGELLVGLYDRIDGGHSAGTAVDTQGAVVITNVSISSLSLLTHPPTLTLFGDTSFGPPTTNGWTRDGVHITNDGSFSISIGISDFTKDTYQQTRYRSTLTVTGNFPGVYQYTVSNRATNFAVSASLTIEGAAPTGLMAVQSGIEEVTVSWTPPSPPPSVGYRITVDSTDFTSGTNFTSETSQTTLQLSPGTHAIRIISLSQHFPSEVVGVEVTVLDLLAPVNVTSPSQTPTSITVSWTQPTNSLPADEYTVSFERVLNALGGGCPVYRERETLTRTTTSVVIDNDNFNHILEGHPYSFTVTARSSRFSVTSAPSAPVTVSTSEIAPDGAPVNVMITTVTSRSISAAWSEISCPDRNGVIAGYAVEFGELGVATVTNTTSLFFTRNGLTPFTDYTLRVAGVNSAGTGVYSDNITRRTDEGTPSPVSGLTASQKFFSIELTWSPPQELNGVITRYEVTYTLNGSPVTRDTGLVTGLNISLTPSMTVFNVSVAAFTSVGRGDPTNLGDISALSQPSMVMNVTVTEQSDTSFRVSWDRLPIPEVTGYIVYYSQTGNRSRQGSEQCVAVSSSENSVEISELTTNMEYQFEVVAIAEVTGVAILGVRSVMVIIQVAALTTSMEAPLNSDCTTEISISMVASTVLTIILYSIIQLVAYCIYHVVCRTSRWKKDISENTYENTQEDEYEDVFSKGDGAQKVEMRMWKPYDQGPSQTPQENEDIQSEVVYDNL